ADIRCIFGRSLSGIFARHVGYSSPEADSSSVFARSALPGRLPIFQKLCTRSIRPSRFAVCSKRRDSKKSSSELLRLRRESSSSRPRIGHRNRSFASPTGLNVVEDSTWRGLRSYQKPRNLGRDQAEIAVELWVCIRA